MNKFTELLNKLKTGENMKNIIIKGFPEIEHLSTGFQTFDGVLNGGMSEGLITLLAMPSLGKTTLALQMACEMSDQRPVIIFSGEMSANALWAKIVSKNSYIFNTDERLAFSASKLFSKAWRENLSVDEQKSLEFAVKNIPTNNLIIVDSGDISMNVKDMLDYAEEVEKEYSKAPVLIVDYLQRLSLPAGVRVQSEKAAYDYSIHMLTSYAHKKHVPVLLISSLNRSSFKDENLDMGAGCGTSEIDYASDVILFLDYAEKNKPSFDLDTARSAKHRHVCIKVVKNRDGESGAVIPLLFTPAFNYFCEEENDTEGKENNNGWSAADEATVKSVFGNHANFE